jgi:hypothetical protein
VVRSRRPILISVVVAGVYERARWFASGSITCGSWETAENLRCAELTKLERDEQVANGYRSPKDFNPVKMTEMKSRREDGRAERPNPCSDYFSCGLNP